MTETLTCGFAEVNYAVITNLSVILFSNYYLFGSIVIIV